MKYLLRVYLFNVFALWLTSQLLPSLVILGGWQVIMTAGIFLSLLMLLVAPVLKILFIPINLLTFGLFSWLINVAVVFLLTFVFPSVTIRPFTYEGATFSGFVIPSVEVTYLASLIITSLTITLITNILHSVSEG